MPHPLYSERLRDFAVIGDVTETFPNLGTVRTVTLKGPRGRIVGIYAYSDGRVQAWNMGRKMAHLSAQEYAVARDIIRHRPT